MKLLQEAVLHRQTQIETVANWAEDELLQALVGILISSIVLLLGSVVGHETHRHGHKVLPFR